MKKHEYLKEATTATAGGREIGSRLTDFRISSDLFSKFETLREHPGYSQVKDVHLCDPEFPTAVTCTPSEAELLFTLVDKLRPRNPLEIGSYIGWSTAHIASALEDVRLQCVEPFFMTDEFLTQTINKQVLERFRQNMLRCSLLEKIDLITKPSPQCLAAKAPDDGWDFLFLDGWHNHGQPLRDIEGVLPYLSPQAVVALHDAWVPDVRDAMLRLMCDGFSVYSLNTANFLTICFRSEFFAGWDDFRRTGSETRHNLAQAAIMRNYLGLCEKSVSEFCSAFGIPNLYQSDRWLETAA